MSTVEVFKKDENNSITFNFKRCVVTPTFYVIKTFRENFLLLFTLLNCNETGWKQCNENDHMTSVFVTFKYRT